MGNSPSFKVLVADDESMLRKSMCLKLEKGGYEVFLAANGNEALETARENLPHVIVSDLMMPVMNGAEFFNEIKSDDRLNHIPVILLSNIDSADDFKRLTGSDTSLKGAKIVKKADMTLDELVDLVNQAITLFVKQ